MRQRGFFKVPLDITGRGEMVSALLAQCADSGSANPSLAAVALASAATLPEYEGCAD